MSPPSSLVVSLTRGSASRIELVKLEHGLDLNKSPSLSQVDKITIEPAHGEEVVRAIWIDEAVSGLVDS